MDSVVWRSPLQPGEPAPDFTLPAVHRDGFVSLADYRGKMPVLLAPMRGLYCAFCRRHIAQLGLTREKLQVVGVEVLAIVATRPERARLYYRFRPVGVPLAADPDLVTHRAYGVPNPAPGPEIPQVIASKDIDSAHELRARAIDVSEIKSGLRRRDDFKPIAADDEDRKRQGAQFIGQFLIDREGIIRWVNIEGTKESLNGKEDFPTDEEFLAAVQALL
jgi:peroxiredoxin